MANPLDAILEKVRELIPQKKTVTSVVGVDIGSSAIKIVQLKKQRGKIVLETYGAVALGPYADKKVGETVTPNVDVISRALADVLKESNVTVKQIALSIQSASSLVFVLDLPDVSEQQLQNVVPNESRKYIPVPLSEVSLDWWVIPAQQMSSDFSSDPRNHVEVLVAAIRNEMISQYQQVIQKVESEIAFFEIEIFSVIRSTFHQELLPIAVLDVGASSTRVAIVEYGIVRQFHTLQTGSMNIAKDAAKMLNIPFLKAEKLKKEVGLSDNPNADPEVRTAFFESTKTLFAEINRLLLTYEKEHNKAIGKIILTGGGSRMIGFQERILENFNAEIVYGDPFSKAEIPDFLREILRTVGPEFSVAVGLALREMQ